MTFHTWNHVLKDWALNLIVQKDYFVIIHILELYFETQTMVSRNLNSMKIGYCIARKIIPFIENGHCNTEYCPFWQTNSGVQDSEPDSCHSTTEDSSKLQQMVLLIWPSNAILKYQLANCSGGGMKIEDLFRARGCKHKCFGIQSLNWYGKIVSNKLPGQIH